MPEQINSSADLWVTVEADITGADSSNDASSSGNASSQPSLMVGGYNASLPTLTSGTTGALQLDSSGRLIVGSIAGTVAISAASLPLPTGAATAANQATGNSHLSTLAGAVSGTEVQVDVVASLPAGTNNIGDVDVVSLPATRVFSSDLALDTSAYASGDVLGGLLEVTNAVISAAGTGTIQSITVIDADDQGQPFDIVFFNQSVTMASANSAWAVSDADMANALGLVRVESADYVDLGGNRIATKDGLSIGIQPASGTSIYAGTISRGAGTYTASGLRLVLSILRDG